MFHEKIYELMSLQKVSLISTFTKDLTLGFLLLIYIIA